MQRNGGYMGASQDPLKKNMSLMNPMDLAAMKQSGDFGNIKNMSVKEVLMKIGIDPEGPAEQLVEFSRKQVENADMVGKMQNIAADSQGEQPGGQPPAAPGLEGLLG